ncbi:nostrin-like [Rhopilema esculentum]|uniref:nostrin-like n=1 Tax=Rhopilema esculentum TaxID=499914 RepID=UPI0031DE7686|eukprot:gene14137-5133_t
MALQLSDVFVTTAVFEDLKKYLRHGNDFCRDVSSIINERVKLEQTYSDGLSKLAVRAKRATGETAGTLHTAWESFAAQTEQEAEIRKSLAGDLLEQIVKPFKAFIDNQRDTRKQLELVVEKAAKTHTDKKADELKAKRTSFKEAKESESLTVQVEAARSRTTNEKELSKLDAKCRKAEENVIKSDKEHIRRVVETERARLALESSLASSCSALQTQEEDRISYLKNMLKAYVEFMSDCVPKVSECFGKLSADTENMDSAADINELIKSKGCEKQPGEQILFTCYEADLSCQMDEQRRKLALESKYEQVRKALRSEKHARSGLGKLASVYQETPKFGGSDTVDDVSLQIAHANAVIDCLDASLYTINCSLSQVNGLQAPQFRLSDCIQKTKDKQNLPFWTLKVPFDRLTIGIPDELDDEDSAMAQSVPHCYESDEFEDIEDGQPHGAVAATSEQTSRASKDYGGRCRAIYDYTAARDDEITIQLGDVIDVISRSDGGWWTGTVNGITGVFPANYVEEI